MELSALSIYVRNSDVSSPYVIREPGIFHQLLWQLHGIKSNLDVDVSQPNLLPRLYLDGGEGLAGCEAHLRRVLEVTGRVARSEYKSLLIVLL